MEANILYQDRQLVLCIKPAGVLSEEGGMPGLLRAQLGLQEVFCVHRLDRAVGGLMVYAKTGTAAAALSSVGVIIFRRLSELTFSKSLSR